MVAVCGAEFDVTCNGQAVPIGVSLASPPGARAAVRPAPSGRARLPGGGRRPADAAAARQPRDASGERAWAASTGRALVAGDRLPIVAVPTRRALTRRAPRTDRCRRAAARGCACCRGRRPTGSRRGARRTLTQRELPRVAALEPHGLSSRGPAAAARTRTTSRSPSRSRSARFRCRRRGSRFC